MTTDLILDSGAYSAKTQNKEIDIDAYIDYIKANQDVFDKYFNLDVIGNGGKSFSNYLYIRAAGLEPIPVWHAETSPIFLQDYLKLSDYVAIGAISVMSTKNTIQSLDSIWKKYLTDDKGFPVCKVHGFGLTSLTIMTRYCWWSVDSTSWVQFGRYGVILIPHTRPDGWAYTENPHIIPISNRSPSRQHSEKHFDTYSKKQQEKFIRYIEHMGFKLGFSEIDVSEEEIVETVIEEGVSNNHLMRDKINMLYYIEVERSMPRWPWQFKPKTNTKDLV